MSDQVVVSRGKLVAVADAIRAKTETADTLTLDEMSSAIEGIKNVGDSYEDAIIARSLTGGYENSSVTTVGQYAFRGCTNVTEWSFPSVKSVGTSK